jgi:hypothetical protein
MIITLAERIAAREVVSQALEALGDEELAGLLAGGREMGTGIGGATVELDVEGVRVFAKKIPLTDVEMLPGNWMSTGNVFGLPTFYQYPVGSAGFGAWREVAAHTMTTDWAIGGGFDGFPLTYHWRVLSGKLRSGAGIDGFADIDAHFHNILTDGDQVYFADFGLATCDDFDLSESERRFLDEHRDYDHAYVYAGLAARSIDEIRGDAQNLEFLRAWIAGDVDRSGLTARVAALVDRYAPLGVLTQEFHRALGDGEMAAQRWPREAVARALADAG